MKYFYQSELLQFNEGIIDFLCETYLPGISLSGVSKKKKVKKLHFKVERSKSNLVGIGDIVSDLTGNIYRVLSFDTHLQMKDLKLPYLYDVNRHRYKAYYGMLYKIPAFNYMDQVSDIKKVLLNDIAKTATHFDDNGLMISVGSMTILSDDHADYIAQCRAYATYSPKKFVDRKIV